VLWELRILYDGAEEEDSRAQIAKLEEAFRRPSPRPAVRSEPNRLRKETASGMALVYALTQAYHVYGLDAARLRGMPPETWGDDLPRVVCSQALVV